MKVVVTANTRTDEFVNDLRATFPNVDFQVADTEEEQKVQIKDADVLFGGPSREVFLAAERLRWIQYPGTGIEQATSVPELVDSDVVLTNCRGPHAGPMADHVFGKYQTERKNGKNHVEALDEMYLDPD